MELRSDHQILVKIQGDLNGKDESIPVAALSTGEWNTEEAVRSVQSSKARYPQIKQVILIADDSISYLDLVKNADAVRQVMPIFLASSESL
jgi:hypothetical protein